MLSIFLSSTFRDLIEERQAIEAMINRMGINYIGMEHFGSFSEHPQEKSLIELSKADVMLLVLRHEYGSIAKGSSISITEAEYRYAKEKGIPVLCYFINENVHPPPIKTDPRLDLFKSELKSIQGISWYSSPADLASKVVADLAREYSCYQTASVQYEQIKNRTDELTAILEDRAHKIVQNLQRYFQYAPVCHYIDQFQSLHSRHIDSLRQGKIMRAHEILVDIHELSFRLEGEEFWKRQRIEKPDMRYNVLPQTFKRGILICGYLTGELRRHSELYPITGNSSARTTITAVVSTQIYEKILLRRRQ